MSERKQGVGLPPEWDKRERPLSVLERRNLQNQTIREPTLGLPRLFPQYSMHSEMQSREPPSNPQQGQAKPSQTALGEDLDVIARVLDGDSAAFEELVRKYERRLLGLLLHACGDRTLAEDMAQEAFARAYRKLNLFAGQAQFYTWLAKIAMNLLASNQRKKRIENQVSREGFEVAMDSVGGDAQPEQQLEQTEMQRSVRAAIAMLDEERRAVLLLRDFDGLEYEAIAETLEIPVGTVRSRLHRARLELKTILQQKASELGFF